EGALLVLGHKAGMADEASAAVCVRIDSIPFESERRYMATLHRDADGEPWVFVKGAPERVLDLCDTELHRDGERPLDVDQWRRMATDPPARGLRVLALACKRAMSADGRLGPQEVRGGFTMLALVGIIDPPREEAIRAVQECQRA